MDIFLCKQPAHEKIGVVDSQWIVHQSVPSLGNQVMTTLISSFIIIKRLTCLNEVLTIIWFLLGRVIRWEGTMDRGMRTFLVSCLPFGFFLAIKYIHTQTHTGIYKMLHFKSSIFLLWRSNKRNISTIKY